MHTEMSIWLIDERQFILSKYYIFFISKSQLGLPAGISKCQINRI